MILFRIADFFSMDIYADQIRFEIGFKTGEQFLFMAGIFSVIYPCLWILTEIAHQR